MNQIVKQSKKNTGKSQHSAVVRNSPQAIPDGLLLVEHRGGKFDVVARLDELLVHGALDGVKSPGPFIESALKHESARRGSSLESAVCQACALLELFEHFVCEELREGQYVRAGSLGDGMIGMSSDVQRNLFKAFYGNEQDTVKAGNATSRIS